MKHNLILRRFPKSAIALFVCTFFLSFSSYEQTCPPPPPGNLIFEGGFEICPVDTGITQNAAINNNCAPPWAAANGTPSICERITDAGMGLIIAPEGDQFACISSTNDSNLLCDHNEAFFQPVALCTGATYELTFSWYNISFEPGTISVALTDSLTNATNTDIGFPCFNPEPGFQTLTTIDVLADDPGWHTVTVVFTAADAMNNQIVFWVNADALLAFDVGFDAISLECIDSPLTPSIDVQGACPTYTFSGSTNSVNGINVASWCWDFGDGSTASGQQVSHTYAASGTYNVYLVIANDCDGFIDTVCQTLTCDIVPPPPVFACPCTGTGTLNIDAGETNPYYDAALVGTLYSVLEAAFNYDQDDDGDVDALEHNQCIAIAGRLIVDRDVVILGCDDVRMQPCSEISIGTGLPVTNYPTLQLRTNNIHGCERMWQGITIQAHCQLVMTKNSFADAQYTVIPIGSNSQQLNQLPTRFYANINRFERNHIGVFIPTTWNEVVWHAPFVNNQFIGSESNQSLLPPCDALLPNYSNQMGYAGLVTLGTSFEVGTPGASGYVNSFLDIRNGVIGENSPWLNVYRANFDNLPGYMNAFSMPTFNASSAVGVLLKGGLSSVQNSRFNQVGHGLFTTDAFNISALNNQMPDVYTGILAHGPRGFLFNQNQNIDFRDFGIIVRNSAQLPGFASKLQINGNHLQSIEADNDGYMEAGISVGGSTNNGNYEDAQIRNNQITLTDVIEGLGVSIVNNWSIHNNNITIAPHLLNLPHQGTRGITLSHSSLNELYSNVVTGISSDPNDGDFGISVGNAPANTFCDNTTSGTSIGAAFRGPCDNTSLRTLTTDNNSVYALFCYSGTILSDQPDLLFDPTDNHSNSFFNGSFAGHQGNPVQVQNSEFRVKTGAPPDHPSLILLQGIPGGYDPNNPQWFLVNGNDTTECDPPQPEGPTRRDELLSSTDEYFASSGFIGSPFGDVLNWEGSLRLYKRAQQYGDLAGQSTVVDAFINNASSGQLGAYAAVDNAIDEIHLIPAYLESDIASAMAEIEVARGQSGTILHGLSGAITWEDSVAVYQAAEEARLTGLPAYRDLMNYVRVADSLRNAKATAAWMLNEALSTNDLIQINRKTVNRVYLETIGQGIYALSNEQFVTISPIAHQCPLVGGSAVYLARNLYLFKEQGLFNDDVACGFNSFERNQTVKRVNQEGVTILPNPASTKLLISLASAAESTTHIKIVDISGRIVWTGYITSGSSSLALDVNGFNSGIYICTTANGAKSFGSFKFVIQH